MTNDGRTDDKSEKDLPIIYLCLRYISLVLMWVGDFYKKL